MTSLPPRLPILGDVITSQKFAYGHKKPGQNIITVGDISPNYLQEESVSEDERVAEAARTGIILPKERTIDLGVPDISRGTAEFVVTDARWCDGGSDRGGKYPDYWQVVAARLQPGTTEMTDEIITFSMSDSRSDDFRPENVTIHRHLTMCFR